MVANRVKTLEWMLPMITSNMTMGTNTWTDTTDTTIWIPETTSRTFNSVWLEVVTHDNGATAVSPTGWGIRASCNSGTDFTSATVSHVLSNSGENMSYIFFGDVTSEFNARFGNNTFGICRYGVNMIAGATLGTYTNASGKLYITYSYNETAHDIRIKTVRIPIESYPNRLFGAPVAIRQTSTAVNQIPALNTFLPEGSVNIRQVFLELWTNTGLGTTVGGSLSLSLDNIGNSVTFGSIPGALQSPLEVRYMWDITSTLNTATEHELYGSNVGGFTIHDCLGGWLTVNYEYSSSASDTILNSVVYGVGQSNSNMPTSADMDVERIYRFVEEPNPISLKQSGLFFVSQMGTTAGSINVSVNNQSTIAYIARAGAGRSGMHTFVHRIDSGANAGSIGFGRGINTIQLKYFSNAINLFSNLSALALINYYSGKHPQGEGVHTQSRFWGLFGNNRTTATSTIIPSATSISLLSPNYYLVGATPVFYRLGFLATSLTEILQARRVANDNTTIGWVDVYSNIGISSNEMQFDIDYIADKNLFKRYPTDTNPDLIDIEPIRNWRSAGSTSEKGLGIWVTYHGMTYPVSGTVTGYTGNGSSIKVDIFRADTEEYIGSATTEVGGAYTFIWYDNVIPLRAVATQGTLSGASQETIAV